MQENIETKESNNGWEISLQGELIKEWLSENGLEDTTENKIKWIKDYSEKYREIIEDNPQFSQEYEKDKEGLKQK